MPTTYETDNFKSGVFEVRGVKRIWVIDKKTGYFAKLKGNTPIYSDRNTEQDLVNKLENNGAELEVIVKLNYERSGKNKFIMCEAHIQGKYFLKGEEFLVVKEIIENHIKEDNTIEDLTVHAFNQAFGIDGMSPIPFDTFSISINRHNYYANLDKEYFNTTLLMRGREIHSVDKEEVSNRVLEIIHEVVR